MDPYLEQFWPDLHARLVLYACDQLEDQLPPKLIARVEERIVFALGGGESRPAYPDVKITERPGNGGSAVAVVSQAEDIEPVIIDYEGPATETFINILEAGPGQRLVTVIEVLSLANKQTGVDQYRYRLKQEELYHAGVSLVEIDLLRRGDWTVTVPENRVPRHVRSPYRVCVRRGWRPDRFELYPVRLRKPLPAVRIPLRERDRDIRLDLQSVLETAYRKGRYHLTIDYDEPPEPPLRGADAKWAQRLMKKAHGR
jgi:hypothetical protein